VFSGGQERYGGGNNNEGGREREDIGQELWAGELGVGFKREPGMADLGGNRVRKGVRSRGKEKREKFGENNKGGQMKSQFEKTSEKGGSSRGETPREQKKKKKKKEKPRPGHRRRG